MAAPDWDSFRAAAEKGAEKQTAQENVAEAAIRMETQCSAEPARPRARLASRPRTSAAISRNGVSAP